MSSNDQWYFGPDKNLTIDFGDELVDRIKERTDTEQEVMIKSIGRVLDSNL